jgi:ferredoxin
LNTLFDVLSSQGYSVVGPKVREGTIVYETVRSIDDLPVGWTDEQDGGKYRLSKRDDNAMFGYAVGPHSWKKFLFPPRLKLWTAKRDGSSFEIEENDAEPPRYAFIGVRSCEIHALAIQDRVFMAGAHQDSYYTRAREAALIVGVNCSTAGGTCFCVSMNTGPKVTQGFDLSLTELIEGGSHRLLIESGSARGEQLLRQLEGLPAEPDDLAAAAAVSERTAASMGRTMPTEGLPDLLKRNFESAAWQDVADRCLSCANCTMSCPTCFCSSVEDTSDVTGAFADRTRRWDSCFTMDFSYIHGGSVRSSSMSRYRQWMTHKLATWHDQFGSSGCVGCGRCITWCPVGIDITEEVKRMQRSESGD